MDASRPETRNHPTVPAELAAVAVADIDAILAIGRAKIAADPFRTVAACSLSDQMAERDVCHAIGLRALKLAGQPSAPRTDLLEVSRAMIETVEDMDDAIDGAW